MIYFLVRLIYVLCADKLIFKSVIDYNLNLKIKLFLFLCNLFKGLSVAAH